MDDDGDTEGTTGADPPGVGSFFLFLLLGGSGNVVALLQTILSPSLNKSQGRVRAHRSETLVTDAHLLNSNWVSSSKW